MTIDKIIFDGILIVDSFSINLRNPESEMVNVSCGTKIGNQQITYHGVNVKFKPDQEMKDFFQKKLEDAIKDGKLVVSTLIMDKK